MATEDLAVTKFREYLRIKTVQPTPDYAGAQKWLTAYGDELGLKVWSIEPVTGKPFVILTLAGAQPDLKSIILYSHIDVVPVFPEHWKYDPFSAHKDEKGDIYARGSQDMKCVGIQYAEAIRRIKAADPAFKGFPRTVHLVYGPDEEIGAHDGMKVLVKHADFAKLNVGFVLDEGLATPDDTYVIYNGERCPWWCKVTCEGNPGHGSLFIPNTAAEKFRKVVNKFLDFRGEQEKIFKAGGVTMGHLISVNMTMISGGVQQNVVPDKMEAFFDIRVPPTTDFAAFVSQIEGWCKDSGEGVNITWMQRDFISSMTDVSSANPYWTAFSKVFADMNLKFRLDIFVGATDSRFLRQLGIQCINFSPMIGTPVLLHDHNEFLNENVFLDGIGIYERIIPNIASVP